MDKMKQESAERKRQRIDEPSTMIDPRKKFLAGATPPTTPTITTNVVIPGPCYLPTDPIPIKVLKHSNRHLAEKLNQRYEDMRVQKEKLDAAEQARIAQQNVLCVLAQQWDQMDREITGLLRGETPPDFSHNPDPIFTALSKAALQKSDTDRVLQLRASRTKSIVQHLTDVVERVRRESAQVEGDDVVKQLNTSLAAAQKESQRLHNDMTPLRTHNEQLQDNLTKAMEDIEDGKTQVFELDHRLERTTNHNTNLKLKLEEVKVAAGLAATSAKNAVNTAANAIKDNNGNGQTGAQAAVVNALKLDLELKTKEVLELTSALEESRKSEAMLKAKSVGLQTEEIKSSAEYKNAVSLHKSDQKKLAEEKLFLRGQLDEVYTKLQSERAMFEALKGVEEDRHRKTQKIINDLNDEVVKLIAERDNLQQTLKVKEEMSKAKGHEVELQQLVDRLQKDHKDAKTEIIRLRKVLQERALKSALLWEADNDKKIKTMQEETKRAIDSEKNLKLLLNVYQNVDKDKREKVNIAYSQQKTKDELLELKKKIASGEVGTESEAKQSLEKIATKMRDLKTAFNEKAKQEEVLLQELESTGSSLDEYEEKNARLTSELKHKEEQMFELMAAKMKAEQARGKLALQGPVHAQEKIKTLDAEVAKKDALVVSLKNGEKHTREAFKASEKRVRETESQLAAVMQEFNQKNAFFGGLQLDLQNQNTQFAKLKLQLVDSVQVSTKLESTVRAKDQQVERIKSDVSRLQSVPSGAGADMYKSTVMLLTKKLNCTICTKRPKNAFINQCMHVFCYDCLIGLIDNRSRKCPKCLLKFGKDDVRKLYMDMDDS